MLDPELKSLVRLFPIWPTYNTDPKRQILKPASEAYILPSSVKWHKTRNSKFYLREENYNIPMHSNDNKIFTDLNVPKQNDYAFTFEDVEFPKEHDPGS